jgi:RimJ/RimL family protein N-acetyltransferase
MLRAEISTQRLRLRPLTMADAARISEFTSDPGVSRMTSRIPLPNPLIAVEGWMMTMFARQPLGLDHVRAIDAGGDGLVGMIGAHGELGWSASRGIEIGYWVGRPFWGRGFATEALRAFADAAQILGPLEAGHFIDNPASGRVLEKGGFAYTGEVSPLFSLARGAQVDTRRMRFDPALWAARAQAALVEA